MKERSSSSNISSSSSTSAWPAGGLPPAASDLAAAVAPLAVMCGADAAPLTQAVRCLPPALQQGVLAHGCQVAQHMRSLGVPLPLLAATLRRCLPLFSKPPAAHAAPLMAELMEAGLNAAEALRCFERSPVVAGSTSLAPSLAALADLLSAGGSETGGSSNSNSNSELPSAAQLQLQPAAALLREQPGAASALLAVRPAELHRRAAYLSSSLGLSAAQLAAAVRRDASLLALPPERLEEQAAALAEELGMSGKQFAELAAACPAALANLAECIEELTHAASGLAGEYGEAEARQLVLACPELLASDPRTRCRSEATLGLLWVSHPRGLAMRRPQLLCAELAEPACVATRLLLQVCFGLSAAEVYELLAPAASGDAKSLACRLSYAETLGLPLDAAPAGIAAAASSTGSPPDDTPAGIVAPAPAASELCRAEAAEHSAQSALTTARPAGLNLDDVATLPQEQLLSRMQRLAGKAGRPWPGSADFTAFAAGFAKRPEWRHLQTAAAAESARLLRLLRSTAN
ncbi:hypothetical protein COHA_000351 [Chlorella ohadii]|uniref:Uncharacterized protein n=1 Tax=Chlorella ohadii TaxID=2649997 RepID=A0AAD5E128_9CHLO|nr:hypothetical protein COHA_000351 [Chlorella ohadii]